MSMTLRAGLARGSAKQNHPLCGRVAQYDEQRRAIRKARRGYGGMREFVSMAAAKAYMLSLTDLVYIAGKAKL